MLKRETFCIIATVKTSPVDTVHLVVIVAIGVPAVCDCDDGEDLTLTEGQTARELKVFLV